MTDERYSLQELLNLRVEIAQLRRALLRAQPPTDEDVFLLRRLVREEPELPESFTANDVRESILPYLIAVLGVGSRLHPRLEEGETKKLIALQLLELMKKFLRLHRAAPQRS